MSQISSFTRTSSLQNYSNQLSRLQATQRELQSSEQQISTGRAAERPSDAPDRAASILALQSTLRARGQESRNAGSAVATLDAADAALGEATTILIEARDTASSQVGVGSDSATREAQAAVIDAQVDALLNLANTQSNRLSVFGGNGGAEAGGRVFERFLGGVRYVGGRENLAADLGGADAQRFNENGSDAFGALSARVRSTRDLAPTLTGETALADLGGPRGPLAGVSENGTLRVQVNGTDVAVDLKHAATLNDVTARVNAAIDSVAPGAGALTLGSAGLELTGAGANTVTLRDAVDGGTAATLGVDGLTSSGGAASAGSALSRGLTAQTALADLGVGIDLTSGVRVTQGGNVVDVDLSAATTVQDLQNAFERLELGVRLDVNPDSRGLNLVSEVAGLELSVGENGGTTATDLGIRSFGLGTRLDDFNHGSGVPAVAAGDDLSVSLHDGTAFTVDLFGAETVADVVTRMQAAAAAAGVAAADFAVGLATTGNGLTVTDNTAGPGAFAIADVDPSTAATRLGLAGDVGAASTLDGEDRATVRVENAFTHLNDLRTALETDSTAGITLAGDQLETDIASTIKSRGAVGVQAQRLEEARQRYGQQAAQEQTVLSDLQDADLVEVLSRYQQLQIQLQASLQVASQAQRQSLLDYL